MAKVSLRIYNREIETMVDRGQLDEAISHCRHILNTFPKNLETYRLLGKAYLEARRYDEATDIFERVLMAVPDDFVAHVGMSIISDERNHMDDAIWHMERAFEVQPSNAAIQAELQRLFGRRDGVEPPKIRLNRGALAHMYLQGELYPQAIAEIKAVLEEDRNRQDMQVLLARACFHAGQKNEAAEICAQLLKRYPYCLDANRILIELLPESEQGESLQAYRSRVNELDPYATFASGSVFHTEEVPDAAVSLDRLEWDGQAVDLDHDWQETRGIGLAGQTPSREEEPDWLKTSLAPSSLSAPQPDEESVSVSRKDNEIPDFLREAGWGKDTGAFKEGPNTFEEAGGSTEEDVLAEGDLPDWIKAMAPSNEELAASTPQSEMQDDLTQDDVPDWLQGLGSAHAASSEDQPLEEGELPDWLAAMKPTDTAPEEEQPEQETLADSASEGELPDWLPDLKKEGAQPGQERSEMEMMAAGTSDEGPPDWLSETESGEAAPQAEQTEDETLAEPEVESDIPDWLVEMKPDESGQPEPQGEEMMAKPASEEELPDWLADLKSSESVPAEEQPEEEKVAEPISEGDLPDWLSEMKAETVAPQEEQEEKTAEPVAEEDLPDWLAAMKTGDTVIQEEQPEEEMETASTGADDLPDWLKSIQAEEDQSTVLAEAAEMEQEPAQDFPETSSESLSDWQIGEEEAAGVVDTDATDTGVLGTTSAEQDDAIAWLEGLAAKHGAKPEELVTNPEERSEVEPEWVQQAKAIKGQETPETPVSQEESTTGPSEDLPGFLAERLEEPTESSDVEISQVQASVSTPSAQEQDDAIAWLETLAAKHGAKPEELVTDPNVRKDTAPEWVQKAADESSPAQMSEEESLTPEVTPESVPDWIDAIEEGSDSLTPELEDTQPHKAIPRVETDETGMWLQNLEDESAMTGAQEPVSGEAAPAIGAEEDLPDWLRDMRPETSKAEAGWPSGEEEPEITDRMDETQIEPAEAKPSKEEEQEVPDWLSDMQASVSEPESEPKPEKEAEEVPDWLAELEGESSGDISIQMEEAQEEVSEGESEAGLEQEVEFQAMEVTAESAEPDLTDWLKSVDVQDEEAEAEESTTEEASSEDLPAWLAGLDQEQEQPGSSASSEEELPDWLRAEEEQEPVHAEPTAPTDWHPADTPTQEEPQEQPEPEPEQMVEEPQAELEPEAEPEATPEPEQELEPEIASPADMAGALSSSQEPALTQAQLELTRGNVNGALENYGRLIKKGKMLDEIIFDLREALYRYPVDVSILQTLGDAYMRANRLQDALDAYTKAEELLR